MLGDGLELGVLLQRLARDVERDVGGVHHAAHEVEVVGHEVGALLLNEHVGGVQRDALLVVGAVQVERGLRGDEEQAVVADAALGVEADGARRRRVVVEGRLVELVVVLLRDLRLGLLPDGLDRVDGLELGVALPLGLVVLGGVFGLGQLTALRDLHAHGVAHVVGVLADELLQAPLAEQFVGVLVLGAFAQVERDARAVVAHERGLFGRCGLDGVAVQAVALPCVDLVGAEGAADHAHLGGNHERGVEAHAKLADDVDVGALGLGVVGLKGLRAGVCDGAQVGVELLSRHADAVVANADGARVLVKGNLHAQLRAVYLHVCISEALEDELVHSVGGVGDELAQENLAVGVDRVDHEVEELLALSLEFLHR